MRTVTIVDQTQAVRPPAGVLANIAGALTAQAAVFCTDWHLATDVQISIAGAAPANGIVMHLVDNADVQGALGYHDATKTGLPEAFVFAATIVDNAGTWTSGPDSVSACTSHELLELLLDLEANEFVYDDGRRMWAKEACDAVEMRSYSMHSVAVSDYVLPAYFTPGARGPFDKLSILRRPFTIDRGGYSIVSQAGAESQVFGDAAGDVEFVPDLAGELALAVGAEYPAWRHDLKAAATSRTMRRLADGQ